MLLGTVVDVDLPGRTIALADGARVPWDYLVLAPGARHAYFSHPEWEALAPGLKNLEDAGEIRRRLLLAFERAEREPDAVARQRTAMLATQANYDQQVADRARIDTELADALAKYRAVKGTPAPATTP